MVEEVLTFPDDRINIGSANVRFFDEELWEFIDNLKETAEAHKAPGLAAIQVAVPLAVVVVRTPQKEWLELINPRIIRHKGRALSTETTLYLPGVVEQIPRFEWISVVYQDRYGKQHTLTAEKHFAYLLQRKIDYIFGGTFMDRVDKKERKAIEKDLAEKGLGGEFNVCPTFSKREYFKSAMTKLLVLEGVAVLTPFFGLADATRATLFGYMKYATVLLLFLIVGYWFYAKWEAEKYVSCTGCQMVSFTAVAVKYFVPTMVLYLLGYYWLNPA